MRRTSSKFQIHRNKMIQRYFCFPEKRRFGKNINLEKFPFSQLEDFIAWQPGAYFKGASVTFLKGKNQCEKGKKNENYQVVSYKTTIQFFCSCLSDAKTLMWVKSFKTFTTLHKHNVLNKPRKPPLNSPCVMFLISNFDNQLKIVDIEFVLISMRKN